MKLGRLVATVALVLIAGAALAEVKWEQYPDPLSSIGISQLDACGYGTPFTIYTDEMADDFECLDGFPITAVEWWGPSWNSAVQYRIRFYSDVPAGTGGILWSRPGDLLYDEVCTGFTAVLDPTVGQDRFSQDLAVPFYQELGTTYWFSVVGDVCTPAEWAYWCDCYTAPQWNDEAVGRSVRLGFADWTAMSVFYPPVGHRDLAFVLHGPGSNVVCDPDPQVISLADDAGGGVYKDEVVVDYVGGGSGDLWAYSIDVDWDNMVVSAVLTDFSRPDNGPFSTMPAFLFQVLELESDGAGLKKVRIDAALGGAPGTSGPCELFKAVFTAVGTPDYATSVVGLTIQHVRDSDNQALTGFFSDDGEVIVDLVGPVITDVAIENDTVFPTTGSHAWVKDGDNLTVYATVTDGGGVASVTADVTDFGGGGSVAPDASTTYEWTLASVNTGGANGSVEVEVTATDTYGNTSTGSDVITADNTVPGAMSGFAAAPGHNKAVLSWNDPTTTDANFYQVEIQSNAWGNYPTYTGGTSYPTHENDGTDVWEGTGNGHTVAYATNSTERNIHYYGAFASDWALNYGPPDSGGQDRCTNYWLGDVARPDNTWNPDGYVHDPDIVKLSGIYGSAPTGDFQKCDVGPTDDHSRIGIPEPDNSVSFEDLMIFAMNYDVVGPAKVVPFLGEPGVGDLALALVENGRTSGGVLELALRLEGNLGEVKGFSAEFEFEGLEFLSACLSDEMSSPVVDMFFWSNATSRSVQVDAAVLGTDVTIGGSGDVVLLTFQVLDEMYSVDFASAQLRGAANEDLTAELEGLSSDGVPVAFKLVQNSPNPFNPVTKVAYHVPSASRVTIRVFDVTGRLVTTLVDGVVEAGRHMAVWNGTNDRGESVGSGVYFCTMETPDFRDSHKMTLLK